MQSTQTPVAAISDTPTLTRAEFARVAFYNANHALNDAIAEANRYTIDGGESFHIPTGWTLSEFIARAIELPENTWVELEALGLVPATLEGACPAEIQCPNCQSLWAPEITESVVCPQCFPDSLTPHALARPAEIQAKIIAEMTPQQILAKEKSIDENIARTSRLNAEANARIAEQTAKVAGRIARSHNVKGQIYKPANKFASETYRPDGSIACSQGFRTRTEAEQNARDFLVKRPECRIEVWRRKDGQTVAEIKN